MKLSITTLLLLVGCLACSESQGDGNDNISVEPDSEIVFEKEKWSAKEGEDYLYRDRMLKDIAQDDSLRELNKEEIIDLFGEPSYYRDNEDFLYYIISQTKLGPVTLRTKTLVIKIQENEMVEWIKIHE